MAKTIMAGKVGVVYEKDGQEHFIKADTVIVAVGYSSNNGLQKQIEGNSLRYIPSVIA